jgi:hypothetical protein
MNERNVDQLLDAWLDLGPDVAPDRVHSAVALEVRTTRQAFGWSRWASERFPSMNNPVRIAVALAAAAVIAFVGFSYLLPDNTGDDDATPTPTVTASPTATPVAVRPLPPFGTGLNSGTYKLEVIPGSDVSGSGVAATFSIGSGWQSGGWYIMNPPAFTKSVSFWSVGNVYEDICAADGGVATASELPNPPVGPNVDDLVAALDAQANTDMSRAADVVVGGYSGTRVTVTEADPYADHCIGDDFPRPMWVDPSGEPGRGIQPGQRDIMWILDVEGQRVVIVATQNQDDIDATESVAAVIDSLEFEVN